MLYSDLKDLLNPEIVRDDLPSNDKVELQEKDISRVFTIGGIDNNNILIFQPDYFENRGKCPYLNEDRRFIHKRCDYIIITRYGDRDIVIFCELKSRDIGAGYDQLVYTTSFFEYLASLSKIDKNKNISQFEKYYIIVTTRSIKRKTNKKLNVHEHKGISIKKSGYSQIHISRIIGG